MKPSDCILVLATALTALMAGLFFAYSVSVSPGLGKLSAPEFIKAMQSINRAIQNPLFFTGFFGAPLLLAVASYQQYGGRPLAFGCLLAAALLYGCGVLGVTVLANVPLNNQLDAFDASAATVEKAREMKAHFETRWNFWNNVRTLASLLAILAAIGGCLCSRPG